MRLSAKHSNQQTVEYRDFTGGLNTTNAIEMIEMNELNRCVNFELMGNLLRTVSGTKDIYRTDSLHFTDMFFDTINGLLLLCTKDRHVYTLMTDGTQLTDRGTLTGKVTPGFASWEDGVLIASGGKLQYWNGAELVAIEASPDVCNGVFVSHGRVIVYYDDVIHYSAVGDETNWTEDSNDDSSSKWLQVGYKDGGKITAVVNLSADIIAFKSNNTAFHIAGQYPDWAQREISRNISSRSWRTAISLTNSAIVLGENSLQAIATTDDYGEIKATDLGTKVQDNIKALPSGMKLRYVAPLNQIWLISGERRFLFMDVARGAFFMREYNSPAVDVCYRRETVFVLKENAVCYLDNGMDIHDDGEPLRWEMYCKTIVSYNDYLVKRGRIDITPLFQTYAYVNYYVGHVLYSELVPKEALQIWHDYTQIYHSKRGIKGKPIANIYTNGDEIYDNDYEIYGNTTYLKSTAYVRQSKRQLDRHKAIKTYGKGSGGRFILNLISYDVAEV